MTGLVSDRGCIVAVTISAIVAMPGPVTPLPAVRVHAIDATLLFVQGSTTVVTSGDSSRMREAGTIRYRREHACWNVAAPDMRHSS